MVGFLLRRLLWAFVPRALRPSRVLTRAATGGFSPLALIGLIPFALGLLFRLSPNLVFYCALALLGLYAVSDKIAPQPDLSAQGCRIGSVYDGDTVELLCDGTVSKARLLGFDAPETRHAQCPQEAALGHRATERMQDLVTSPGLHLSRQGKDKYQRDLLRVSVGGVDAGTIMVGEGLAVAYHGAQRIDWCARLRG